ncbi:unnamed protein product [Caretta caretta]
MERTRGESAGGAAERTPVPHRQTHSEEIPCAGEIPCPSDDARDYYNRPKGYCN